MYPLLVAARGSAIIFMFLACLGLSFVCLLLRTREELQVHIAKQFIVADRNRDALQIYVRRRRIPRLGVEPALLACCDDGHAQQRMRREGSC